MELSKGRTAEEYRPALARRSREARLAIWAVRTPGRYLLMVQLQQRRRQDRAFAGVAYDGNDPRYEDLYLPNRDEFEKEKKPWAYRQSVVASEVV